MVVDIWTIKELKMIVRANFYLSSAAPDGTNGNDPYFHKSFKSSKNNYQKLYLNYTKTFLLFSCKSRFLFWDI